MLSPFLCYLLLQTFCCSVVIKLVPGRQFSGVFDSLLVCIHGDRNQCEIGAPLWIIAFLNKPEWKKHFRTNTVLIPIQFCITLCNLL